MLTNIHIAGFKSLVDLKAELKPLTVVFGPNAAGKSNFLESLLLLSRLATERTVAEALEPPIRGLPLEFFNLPTEGLPGLLEQPSAEFSLDAKLLVPRPGTKRRNPYRYRVACTIRPESGEVGVSDEYLPGQTKNAQPRMEREGKKLIIRQSSGSGHPIHEPLPAHHTQISNPRWTGQRFPLFDAVRRELSAWRVYYLDPLHAMRSEQGPRDVPDIGVRGEFIAPFLFRLKKSREHGGRFETVRRALSRVIPSIEHLDVDLDERRGTLDIRIRQDGTEFSSRIVSEGTLRVLALCAIAVNPWSHSLVAFEEPENGVHPKRIELIARMLENIAAMPGRQVVVTTHSPTLVSEALKLKRQAPDRVGLLVCERSGRRTILNGFDDPQPLLEDQAVRDALASDEDSSTVAAMLERGWFDG